ncbi:MAG TPA: PepSY domain-containing protein [Stellaceae bacterium]|nr:PepSY domain-containing protein [Stellaceae bacterium]
MPSTRGLRRWYAVHKWTSLVCTAVLLLLCLTGLPLVFKDEIGRWSGTTIDPPVMPADTPRVSVDRFVADARARRPDDAVRYVSQSDDAPAWFVSMGKTPDAAEASAVFKYDARTGAMIHDVPQRRGVIYVIETLHETLFAGLWGTLFLGAMGLLFMVALASGLVVYARFMRRLPFGTVRRHRTKRILWADLHNLLGIGMTAWMLVVGLTGVVNTLAQPLLLYWRMTELAEMTTPWRGRPPPAELGSLQGAIDAAREASPGMDVAFVGFPGSRFSTPHHYMVFLRGDTPLTARLLRPVMIDAETDAVTASRSLPWYLRLLLLSQPLHFGDYGGLPLKVIWALLDLAAIVILVSGLYLWLSRRKSPVEMVIAELDAAAGGTVAEGGAMASGSAGS